jgi:hypothetical protein
MQLFVTNPDPIICALELDNLRVNKIIMESAQIICTVLHGDGVKGLPYKPTHAHHPITVWAADKQANLNWVKNYHLALMSEKLLRTDKTHASGLPESVLSHISSSKQPETFQNSAKNDSLGLDFTWCKDVHRAYRLYLSARWATAKQQPRWANRTMPLWFNQPGDAEYIKLCQRAERSVNKGNTECPRCGNELKTTFASKKLISLKCPTNLCLSWTPL